MSAYRLVISSPDGELFRGEVEGLWLRGCEGDLAILAGHVPLCTALRAGIARIALPEGEERRFSIDGGILTVGREETVVLCGEGKEASDSPVGA